MTAGQVVEDDDIVPPRYRPHLLQPELTRQPPLDLTRPAPPLTLLSAHDVSTTASIPSCMLVTQARSSSSRCRIASYQTLSRTIITAGTTFLSVLSIFLFGGEALRGFSFTMLVGIVSGTYSTVFIASASAVRYASSLG